MEATPLITKDSSVFKSPSARDLTPKSSCGAKTGVESNIGSTFPQEEVEVPKDMVDLLLRSGQATVICELEKRTRSDVWKYFGRIQLPDGRVCKDVVGCVGCHMVYLYRSKSQGTSTLRHHKCAYVFHVLGKYMGHSSIYGVRREGGSTPEGRQGHREMTPEAEDRKPIMPTPPPLREHMMSSSPPQNMHGSLQPSSGGGSGSSLGRLSSGANSAGTPPPHSHPDQPNQSKDPVSLPQQLLCVRWGNFDSNIVSMFTKLRSQEHFVDATLWCEGKTIKCHKMILSACSTYFEKLLTENPNPHPIVFLKDMRFWEITALVEFMYKGEVSIHQEKLQSLLRAAESLQIKGLGSPSANDGAAGGVGGLETDGRDSSGLDDELSNGTMDMSTTHSHNNHSNSLSSKFQHNSLPNSNNNSMHSANLTNSHFNNHNSPSSILNMNMGIDLSNHGSAGVNSGGAHGLPTLQNSPLSLSLSMSSALLNSSQSVPSKRRKKETPRRLDIPRAAIPIPVFNSTMASDNVDEDFDDNASEDSMPAHERNQIDSLKQEPEIRPPHITYEDEDEAEGQENYVDHESGSQMEDDKSDSEHGDADEEMEAARGYEETDETGALSLRVASAAERERLERERSRKGNPMKIHGHNNNNNNEGTSIFHSPPSAAD